jgi:hypothetical protein
MYKIASQLSLRGEPIDDAQMMEKQYLHFHVANVVLAQRFQNMYYMKYFDLMLVLLLVGKQNEVLLKNHGKLPSGMFPMQSHATQVLITQFTCQGLERTLKLKKRS